jgi:phage terminase large subunit GpA-like protein
MDGVEVIAIEVAAQCGKTTLDIALALYGAEWLSGPGLFLMPSEEHAEDLVRDRLRPIFQASPFGRGLKASEMRLGGVTFPGGGSLNVIGVGSPNALKGRPARWVVFDEYDEALRYSSSAGSPYERAATRTRTYGSLRRIVLTSTPTVEDAGIHPIVEAARRYEWHCPCPHCGTFQRLELGQVWWPRGEDGQSSESPDAISSRHLARYLCKECSQPWTDAQRMQAIASGREHCLDPDRPMRTVALPAMSVLYSPDVTISETAAQFLRALADPVSMVQFRNEWLAEPRSEIVRTASTDQAHLMARQLSGYLMPSADWWEHGEIPACPDWVRSITWGYDVQGSEVWGLCRGWGDKGESIILWAGSFRGSGDLENAATAFRRPWYNACGEIQPIRGCMDSGYRTHEVYRVCATTSRLIPSKGRQDGTLPVSMSQVDRQGANRRIVGQVALAVVWTTYWQDEVARALEQDPGRGPLSCHLPENSPAFLLRHLCAERKKPVKRRDGKVVSAWVAHDSQNHLRDCLVYSQVAAGVAKVHDLAPRKAGRPEPIDPRDAGEQAPTPPPKQAGKSGLSAMLAARRGQMRDGGRMG